MPLAGFKRPHKLTQAFLLRPSPTYPIQELPGGKPVRLLYPTSVPSSSTLFIIIIVACCYCYFLIAPPPPPTSHLQTRSHLKVTPNWQKDNVILLLPLGKGGTLSPSVHQYCHTMLGPLQLPINQVP